MTILNMTYGQGNPYQPFHLNAISDLSATPGNKEATITWTDPSNLVVDGQTLATWSSTKLVRKVGSAPSSSSDGTLVVEETVANTYSVNGYTDTGLTGGTTYYYGAFAVAENGLETISSTTPSVTPTSWGELVTSLGIYRPLVSDANDYKLEVGGTGTVYNASWVGTASYTTVGDKTSANFAHTYNSGNYVTSSYYRNDIPITIACWAYSSNQSSWQTVLSTQDAYSDGGNKPIWIGKSPDNGGQFGFGWGKGGGQRTSISINTWYFICLSIDSAGNWKGYIGDTYYSGSGGLSMTFNKRWQVGNGASNGYYGNIREVAIWERALSQSEMLEYKALTQ